MQAVDDWQELNRQLEMLLDQDTADRLRSLDELAASDPAKAQRLQRLLAGITRSEPLEQLGAVGLVQEALQSLETLGPGDTLGDWTLQRRIGRGGMAEVFEASRQIGGTGQRAAIKLMAMGLGSEEQRRRFRQETAILARVDDARLSRLIDAGTAADGRPWLAMEFIDGRPIDQACQAESMGLRERVALLIEVARAVDSCHRALVVHRDLKPSNVFVTAQGEVRLLDFGIAKVVEPQPDPAGFTTRFVSGAYTLRFSSPEQLQSLPTGVDCDVYQLGLLLYLLLTGRHAFESRAHEPLGLLRAMQQGAAPPSSVASGPTPGPTHWPTHGPTPGPGPGGNWAKRLRGDLDAIMLRALEFRPADRYPGARELADDLQAWLDGYPVSARSHTTWYRARRYVRRHWLGVAMVMFTFLLVSGYAATVTWQSQRLAEQRNQAEAAKLQAETIRDFLLQVFGSVDPQSQVSRGKTIEQLLMEGVQRARTEYVDQPLVAAQLLVDMADVLARRGRLDEARSAFEDALRMRTAVLGVDHADTLAAGALLGDVLYRLGDGDAALALLRRNLETAQQVTGGSPDAVIDALTALGPVESVHGDMVQAEAQMRRALELQSALYPQEPPDTEQALRRALILNQLGVVLMRAERFEEAMEVQQQSLATYEKFAGRLDSRTLEARKNLSYAHRMLLQPAEARRLLEVTLADERELYDGAHWQIAYTLGHLANLASDVKDYPESIRLWQEAETETRAAMGDDYYWINSARMGRARSMLRNNQVQEGRALLLEVINSPNADPAIVKRAGELLATFPGE